MSKELSLRLDLLDRQLLDCDDLPFGRVDDLVLELEGDGPPQVVELLTGAQALGERLGHALGRIMARAASRLRSDGEPGPAAIDAGLVRSYEHEIQLELPLRELQHVAGLEHWLSRNLIERLPGSGDAGE